MFARAAVATLIALLATASPAAGQGGDPIMPLSEVRSGMECTGYSVIRGTEVSSFDVEILDIVGGEAGARLLVRASGDAVDETGIGAGFSGSPIYCPDSQNRMKNAGAISETIGEYGGKTVLATPIEAILATQVNPPAEGAPATGRASRSPIAGATPLSGPLTVRGLSGPIFRALAAAARKRGRTLLQAPPALLQAPPAQSFRPGSAMSVGLSNGDVSVGAVGTVAYVDGADVWALGHPFDGLGRRSLFLQNAYVAAVINNPVQLAESGGTYKLAGATNDVGTVTNDGFSAVAGTVGPFPEAIPVRIFASDQDTGRETTTEVGIADETDIGTPTGSSSLAFVGPLAVTQAATGIYDSTPPRMRGEMCMRIVLRERKRPFRICNRYVSDGTGFPAGAGSTNAVALSAGTDAAEVLSVLDTYKPRALHVTEFSARIRMRRGQFQAYMRDVKMPARVRPGQRVKVAMKIRRVRGSTRTIRFPVEIPRIKPGYRRFVFRGSEPESGDEDLFGTLTIEFGEPEDESPGGPATIEQLVREMRRTDRYDGIRMRVRGLDRKAFEHPELRIGGRMEVYARVVRR